MPKPTTLRIPSETKHAIDEIVRRSRRDFSSVANEMLEEAVRMRRIPGIIFADGPSGRRARIAGTGLEVFEVVAGYRQLGKDFQSLAKQYHWLSEHQLRAALAYYEAYPEEIEARIEVEERWSEPDDVHEAYPFTRCATT